MTGQGFVRYSRGRIPVPCLFAPPAYHRARLRSSPARLWCHGRFLLLTRWRCRGDKLCQEAYDQSRAFAPCRSRSRVACPVSGPFVVDVMQCNVVNRSGNLNNPNKIHFKTTSYYVSIHCPGQLIFRDLAVLLSSAICSCLSTFRLSILLDKLCCNQGCFRT